MPRYLTLNDLDLAGKRVLVRSDLNVPIEDGRVADDFRIRAAVPTLERLLAEGASVTVCSHLGRPEGRDESLSLRPVAEAMAGITEHTVALEEPADITMLENTRFLNGETSNDPAAADHLADDFQLFVQDAFGSVHRAHASTVGIAERVKSVAGPLLDAELNALGRLLDEPERPFVVILGGAKVSDKLGVIENLLPKVDALLVGGGMCFTLLAAKGYPTGDSLVEDELVGKVGELVNGPMAQKIILPTDVVVGDEFSEDATPSNVYAKEIPEGTVGLDIGRETEMLFTSVVRTAESVFWNGPMGVYEWADFRSGTEAVARALVETTAFSVVGGGDSAAALRSLGIDDGVSHLSTGGGASLELLEGRSLPGVHVLERWKRDK